MLERFRNQKFGVKLSLLVLLAVGSFMLFAGLNLYASYGELISAKRLKTRHLVEAAHSVVAHYAEIEKQGGMTTAEAQQAALAALNAMRYEGNQYFWVNDLQPVMLMHPFAKKLEGASLSGTTDPNGKHLFAEFVNVAKTNGEGFVDYQWPPPGAPEATPIDKISFVKLFEPWGWIVGSGIYIEDVRAAFATEVQWVGIALLGMVVLLCAVAFFIVRGVTGPLGRMNSAMQQLAEGNVDVAVPFADARNELGGLARALQVFKDSALERRRLEEAREVEREAKEARARTIDALIEAFDSDVGTVLETVGSASADLQETSRAMTSAAEESTGKATSVAAASEQASGNVQTVAAATEEMAASIREIAQQMSISQGIARDASQEADRTDATVSGLLDAAQRIGEVVELISSIAARTNLLALNATIEAARAGEAGKGFAVVASEVKSLATQTAKATEEITTQVQAVRGVSGETATAIRSISGTIARLNEIATSISAAIEEQDGTTQEIARNVQQAAAGTQEVSTHIVAVTAAARETGSAADRLLGASEELAGQSRQLSARIERFLTEIRAA